MTIDLKKYKASLSRCNVYHGVISVLSTAMTILLWYNSLFENRMFTQTLQAEFDKNKKNQHTFNEIAYPVFALIFIIFLGCICRIVAPVILEFFEQEDYASGTTSERILADKKKLTELAYHYATILNIPQDFVIKIVRSSGRNVCVFQLSPCSVKQIIFTAKFLGKAMNGDASIPITLAHECIHLKYDTFFGSSLAQSFLHLGNVMATFLGYLPLQVAYVIAGSIAFNFQSTFLYRPALGIVFSLFNILNLCHCLRTKERRADFESLCSAIPFEAYEYDKAKRDYGSPYTQSSTPSITETIFSFFSTHPLFRERIELIEAVQAERGQAPIP